MKPITKFELYEIDDPAEPYRVVMWCLPPGPPEDPRIGERFPEGSIEVPKSFGAIWFDVSTWQGGFVAQATFAADADAVRCDTITVNEAHRMKGVATQLYETASGVFQGPVIPSDNQTPDPVDLRAGPVGFVGQRQQGANVVDLEPQLPRMANEGQPPRRSAVVKAPVACRARRLLHQTDLLVEPDRRNLHAGLG